MKPRGYRIALQMLAVSENAVVEMATASTVEMPAEPGGLMPPGAAQLFSRLAASANIEAAAMRKVAGV
jgi:hypothetical protein